MNFRILKRFNSQRICHLKHCNFLLSPIQHRIFPLPHSSFAYTINVCATVDSLFCHFTSYNSFSEREGKTKNKHRLTYMTQSLSFRWYFFAAEYPESLGRGWGGKKKFMKCFMESKIKSMRQHHNSISFSPLRENDNGDFFIIIVELSTRFCSDDHMQCAN